MTFIESGLLWLNVEERKNAFCIVRKHCHGCSTDLNILNSRAIYWILLHVVHNFHSLTKNKCILWTVVLPFHVRATDEPILLRVVKCNISPTALRVGFCLNSPARDLKTFHIDRNRDVVTALLPLWEEISAHRQQ